MMSGFASYVARDSIAVNQPPAASTMKKQVITMIPENSRNITVTAAAQFKKLYDKVSLLKDINSGKRKREWEKEQEKKRKEIENEDRDGFGNYDDDEKPLLFIDPISFVLKAMMSVKSVNVSYSRNEGHLLPGLATER